MSKVAVPAGKWRLRPFDPQCQKFVDHVPVVEEQIRCKVPAWSGDFGELTPELIAGGLRLDELPRLSVHDVGQFVIRAFQGGSLNCGTVGTATHTIVSAPFLGHAAEDNSWHAGVARRLESTPRRVLCCMRENNAKSAIDKLTRKFIADTLRVSIDEVAAAGEVFKSFEKPLIESVDGSKGGWWLSPDGERVAARCALPVARVVRLTQSRKTK
jgi:hypothetical protein